MAYGWKGTALDLFRNPNVASGMCVFASVVLSTDGDIADTLFSCTYVVARPVRRHDLVNEVLTVYEIRARRGKQAKCPRGGDGPRA
jgi:hypothetical protein